MYSLAAGHQLAKKGKQKSIAEHPNVDFRQTYKVPFKNNLFGSPVLWL